MDREEAIKYGEEWLKALLGDKDEPEDEEDSALCAFLSAAIEALKVDIYELTLKAYKHGKADGCMQGKAEQQCVRNTIKEKILEYYPQEYDRLFQLIDRIDYQGRM